MTDSAWKKCLFLLNENESIFSKMRECDPTPSAKLCRSSAHRTLGHAVACQAAWLPILRALKDGESRVVIPVNPDPLYRQLAFGTATWGHLLDRFRVDRAEWRSLLNQVEIGREIRTSKRVYTVQTLTKRMVEHETRHLDDLSTTESMRRPE